LIWRGHVRHGAERLALSPGAAPDKARERVAIRTRARPASGARVLISRSHLDAATDAYIDRLTRPEKIACGSALKFGLLAEGSADLYPRLGPMSEWDIAAGHAVLVAAGGAMRKLDGAALHYGQGNFLVAGFIATGDVAPVV
jgi:3'(2'), 5'-bisphosphate nucleotidase